MAIYIKFPDIKGPCIKANHEEWVELDNLSWGANRQSDSAQQGGLISGISKMEYVSYSSNSCAGSATLFQYMIRGQHCEEILIHATKNVGGEEAEPWFELTLTDAIITQVNQDIESDQSKDHVTMAFGMFNIKIKDQLKDGSLDTELEFEHDVRTGV
jgi:type VI protein secretion system component Hcp